MTWWPTVQLGDVLSKSSEWADLDPAGMYTEITIRLWGRGVVARGQASGAALAASRRHVVRAGQLVMSRIDARQGAIGIVPQSLDGAVATNDFPAFTAVPGVVLPEFLGVLARTEWFIALCSRVSEGTTNRVRVKESGFLRSAIPLPPLTEQARIVAAVAQADSGVGRYGELAADRARQLDDLLFSAYTRLVDEADLVPMGVAAPLVRRPVAVEQDGSYPELGVRSFGKGTFHKPAVEGHAVGSKKLFHIEPGDLLFSNVFAWEGAVAVAQECDRGRVGSHRFITCVPDPERMTAEFLRYHFLTEAGTRALGQASPGGAGRNRTLGLAALAAIPVPVPPIARQLWFNRLNATVTTIMSEQQEARSALARFAASVIREEIDAP